MLGMGDRYSENTGGQAEVGGDPRSGFGRLKLRLLDGEQFSIDSYTFNTAQYTTHSYIPFSSPIGSTAKIVKCVSHNSEDVSSWNSFGEVNLSIRAMEPHIQYLPPPYSPIKYCALPSTMVSNSLIVDNMKDNKHMVAANQYTSVDISKYLGKCLLVDVQGRTPWKTFYYYGIPYISNKLVTSHVFCYVADKSDEE
jgi:hypothetical protein